MILKPRIPRAIIQRTFKNFGHKREPVPLPTTLWHGFLTFTFMAVCVDWAKIGSWFFTEQEKENLEEGLKKPIL